MANEIKPKEAQSKEEPQSQRPPMRQIIIETDGSNINLIKNETAGMLELAAVLQTILAKLMQK